MRRSSRDSPGSPFSARRGGAVLGGREVDVAAAALASARDDDPLAVGGDVEEEVARLRVAHLGADRHALHALLAGAAVAVAAAPVLPAGRADHAGVCEVEQGGHALVALEHDIAALAAVAAGGSAERNELLATERDDAVPAVAGDDLDLAFVHEPHMVAAFSTPRRTRASVAGRPPL